MVRGWWWAVRGLEAESEGLISSGYGRSVHSPSNDRSLYGWLPDAEGGDTCTPDDSSSSEMESRSEVGADVAWSMVMLSLSGPGTVSASHPPLAAIKPTHGNPWRGHTA